MKKAGLYLTHMRECVGKIGNYVADGETAFLTNTMAQDAVYRNLEILGEAAKRIPDDIRQMAPKIPWRQIAGLRDVLIHQYDGIDPQEVWKVVEQDLPRLKSHLLELIHKVTPP